MADVLHLKIHGTAVQLCQACCYAKHKLQFCSVCWQQCMNLALSGIKQKPKKYEPVESDKDYIQGV
jgi:hypothetical protein